jgi:uncharacterized protein YutE (UPF0331/DUF86 family)
MNTTLEKDTILKRTNGIQLELEELKKLGALPFLEFSEGDGYKLAQYHLHRALEGVFNIAAHILSRIPGAQATTYKDTALKLGEFGIVPKEFAENNLAKMANYRNRLVHFYAEITPQELYDLLRNNLGDFDIFLRGVKELLENPVEFGLSAD